MHDAGVGRDDLEVAEGALPPLQEGIALDVALVVELLVEVESGAGAECIHLDGVVDDELDRLQRVDLRRVAAEVGHGIAHGGEVHHRGHAGEVLQQHPSGHEGDLPVRRELTRPAGEGADVVRAHRDAVLVAQQVLQQDPQRIGEPRDVQPLLLQCGEAEDLVVPVTYAERRASSEAVRHLNLLCGSKSSLLSRSAPGACSTGFRRGGSIVNLLPAGAGGKFGTDVVLEEGSEVARVSPARSSRARTEDGAEAGGSTYHERTHDR